MQDLTDQCPDIPNLRLRVPEEGEPLIEAKEGNAWRPYMEKGLRPWMGWLLSLAADGVRWRQITSEVNRDMVEKFGAAPLSPLRAVETGPPPSEEQPEPPISPPASSDVVSKTTQQVGSQPEATTPEDAPSPRKAPRRRTRSK